ncbi:PTS sugar transporter subunit IIA [Isoptericola sp. b441]|uniref:Ascorbate-specific PTS system EIIA component n=1 Tax=Actinotalea lenta TaxID=3064654 RepID=A0ABT9D9W3_9CELL|nr:MULTISPECIES: PTS sugar transporter subunit IIA [unclassified Isoptericola]MDO8107692.1 PTS sugar transporter subunit IIA [Isoptericola sp. b441]MDO8120637.1 PTS sugar transporter subunit IIA [Isoptericola sp. b490]
MTGSTGSPASLGDLLPSEAVAAHVEVETWEEAVRASGDLLVATGSATPEYTDQMIAAIHRYGPYIVIAPGFALAHAQASDDVLNTGMSFMQLAHPVRFGHEKNDPVRLVAGLASTDHSAHMEALQQLALVLSSPETMEQLLDAGTVDELCAVLGIPPSK